MTETSIAQSGDICDKDVGYEGCGLVVSENIWDRQTNGHW
jgi:hypothetical protein